MSLSFWEPTLSGSPGCFVLTLSSLLAPLPSLVLWEFQGPFHPVFCQRAHLFLVSGSPPSGCCPTSPHLCAGSLLALVPSSRHFHHHLMFEVNNRQLLLRSSEAQSCSQPPLFLSSCLSFPSSKLEALRLCWNLPLPSASRMSWLLLLALYLFDYSFSLRFLCHQPLNPWFTSPWAFLLVPTLIAHNPSCIPLPAQSC